MTNNKSVEVKNTEVNNANEIDVSPDMRFYNLLESYPYTVKGALCEYIDNAVEAYKTAKKFNIAGLPKTLTISIDIDDKRIIIDDNGVGIPTTEIQRAMKPAYKPTEQSLSEFGIGMKAASMWFGKCWTLESYPIDRTTPFKIDFDLEKLIKENEEKVTLKILENTNNRSGVKIILTDLTQNIDEKHAERTWEELQETYQLFCSRTDPKPILKIDFKFRNKTLPKKDFSKLIVTNEPLVFPICKFKNAKLYTIGDNIVWKKDISFDFSGKLVQGFISLGKESSQVSNPGLRLFRFGRLIKGMEIRPYRPVELVGTSNKAAPSRFYAELHLDGQAISNSKGEFIFDEYLFIEKLKEQPSITEFIEQAENYRERKVEQRDFTPFDSWEEFEKETGAKRQKPKKDSTKPEGKKPQKKLETISILEKLSAPSTFLLLDVFLEEAIQLYRQNRVWPFCLIYRAILEVSIIDKIKSLNEEHYDKAKTKSIVSLYKYLQSNSDLIPDEYETLKRVLKENNREHDPFVGILNIASHGRYIPAKYEVDDLLRNTQQLVEWAFDRES